MRQFLVCIIRISILAKRLLVDNNSPKAVISAIAFLTFCRQKNQVNKTNLQSNLLVYVLIQI